MVVLLWIATGTGGAALHMHIRFQTGPASKRYSKNVARPRIASWFNVTMKRSKSFPLDALRTSVRQMPLAIGKFILIDLSAGKALLQNIKRLVALVCR